MERTARRRAPFIIALACLLLWPLAALPYDSVTPHEKGSQKGQDAKALFVQNCATCHGKDGRAKTFKAKFNHARNLTDTVWQEGVSDERLFNSIANGRGRMPSFRKKLSEADINALVGYVRSLNKSL